MTVFMSRYGKELTRETLVRNKVSSLESLFIPFKLKTDKGIKLPWGKREYSVAPMNEKTNHKHNHWFHVFY
jgi:hypothetical protein